VKTNKTKVVFIAGTSHSGSTLLDKILGIHPNGVSLGEVYLTYQKFKLNPDKFDTLVCSCGQLGNSCNFWKAIFKLWLEDASLTYSKAYTILISYFQATYGTNSFLIDSSKYLPALKTIQTIENIDIYVIHIVKDVRSYLVSQIDRAKQKGKSHLFSNLKHARSWYNQNSKIHNYCVQNNLKFTQLGYEEFCLYSELALNDICQFLDEIQSNQMLQMENDKSHLLTGNSMRLDAKKAKIQYDYRWFNRRDWFLPYFLSTQVRNFNVKMVYSKQYHQIFNRFKKQ
jgi:hypothetical protein